MDAPLTVLIATHNGRQHLRRCLPSVVRHAPRGTQVLVVDDASTDGSAEWLARCFGDVELLRLEQNVGFAAAVNAGLRHSRGRVVELLNNDTEVRPGWAAAALRHFDDPAVGSVAPLVLRMERPEIIDSAGQEYLSCGWAYDRGFGQPLGPRYQSACEVFGASGSAGFYRAAALRRTGGLLPDYDAYFEDTDLAFRLRWAGYRCIYEPESQVLHRRSATYGRRTARTVRLLARNEELAWWINLPARELRRAMLPHLGFLAVRAVRKLLDGQIGPFAWGKWQALSLWRTIRRRRREVQALAQGDGAEVCRFLQTSAGLWRRGWEWLRRRRCA